MLLPSPLGRVFSLKIFHLLLDTYYFIYYLYKVNLKTNKNMKTLKQIISEIDFNKREIQSDVDWETLSGNFRLDLGWSANTRLKAYYIVRWYCTDSWVGIRVYFLDGEFVALSSQLGRKDREKFEFPSKESALKVRDYIQYLIEPDDRFNVNVNINLLDDEYLDKYQVNYNEQILQKKGYYNDELVDIIQTRYNYDWDFQSVKIKLSDGTLKKVRVKELYFDYNT